MINKLDRDVSLLIKAINQTGVGVVISNPRLPGNPLIYVNKGFEDITGYCAEEVIGHNCRFLQGQRTKPEDVKLISRAIREQQPCEVELLNYRKNGELFWNELQITPIFDENNQLEYFIGIQKDVTARKKEQDARILYEKVFNNTLQGVIITDQNSNILLANAAFTKITGYSIEEALGKKPNILSSGKQGTQFYQKLWRDIKEWGQWEGEIWNKRKNGEIYPEFLNISEVRGDDGEITNYVAIFTDITESKNREKRLAQLSMEDPLTGIANRRKFDNYLEEKWFMLTDIQEPISLILIDIDHFKTYNDYYGHQQGDQCLIQIAHIIEESFNEKVCLTARYGGEEFAVILPQYDVQASLELAKRMCSTIKQKGIPHAYSLVEDIVSVSCGVATMIPNKNTNMMELIANADQALYEAKNNGRNQIVTFKDKCQVD
ncbi:GGDEF domain-containing protein [Lysinibacillus sp. BW-2-10]|uniref:sensor domain-containing diguanylate cyclase n=1 Tax=Lysinibacillus sp. BW-2-10 TaxID=2590030 RepID=UPI00117D022B|nr:GGDEF domain-containing protein [Lysinibacillus sp. BW-2-10]TSI02259.1 diguanylate cyclase [Lysinibacillus sp. BW-2-10]